MVILGRLTIVLAVYLVFIACAQLPGRRFHLPVENGVSTWYQGKYKDHPEIKNFLAKLPKVRDKALAEASQACGLTSNNDSAVFAVSDMTGRKKQNFHATTGDYSIGSRRVAVVTVNAHILSKSLIKESTYTHEAIHALMRHHMGSKHKQVPDWFREGIAVWGSKQLDEKLAINIPQVSKRKFESLLNGFNDKKHNLNDYLEDALLFEYAYNKSGQKGIHDVIKRVVNGEKPRQAFSAVIEQPWKNIESDFQKFALSQIQKHAQKNGIDSFEQAEKLYVEKSPKAKDSLNSFLETYQSSFYRPIVYLYVGRILNGEGNYQEAMQAYDLVDTSHAIFLADDLQVLRGQCLARQGKTQEAIALLQHFLDSYTKVAPIGLRGDASYFLGKALYRERPWDARSHLIFSFKHSRSFKNASLILLLEHFLSTGNKEAAIKYFKRGKAENPKIEIPKELLSKLKQHL
jgi:tetratricopeptide (TPR) repeat protein